MKLKPRTTTAPETTDPAALARQAAAESATAMREGRYADARALTALTDAWSRIADRQQVAALDDERLDAAGEQVLREDLLRRLDALAAEIAAREA